MQPMYYIGLEVHEQKISYCIKDSSGKIQSAISDVKYQLSDLRFIRRGGTTE